MEGRPRFAHMFHAASPKLSRAGWPKVRHHGTSQSKAFRLLYMGGNHRQWQAFLSHWGKIWPCKCLQHLFLSLQTSAWRVQGTRPESSRQPRNSNHQADLNWCHWARLHPQIHRQVSISNQHASMWKSRISVGQLHQFWDHREKSDLVWNRGRCTVYPWR